MQQINIVISIALIIYIIIANVFAFLAHNNISNIVLVVFQKLLKLMKKTKIAILNVKKNWKSKKKKIKN